MVSSETSRWAAPAARLFLAGVAAVRRVALLGCTIACLTVLSCASVPVPRVVTADDFAGPRIDRRIWITTWWNRQDGITNEHSRSGPSSLRMTVRPGDYRMYGRGGQATERSELMERQALRMGTEARYTYSVFVPEDFPIADVRLVISQWKQLTVRYGRKRSPVVAARYRNGRFSITIDTARGQEELYGVGSQQQPALVGEWTDFDYDVRFAADGSGILDVWMNGERIVSYRGVLGYPDDLSGIRFRLGLYRDAMDEPMSVSFDAFERVVAPAAHRGGRE